MTRKPLAVLLVLGLLLAFAATVSAKGDDKRGDGERPETGDHHGRPEFAEKGSKFLLHNDKIAVWFNAGKNHAKPDLRIAFNGTNDTDEKSGYRVQLLRLYEAPEGSSMPGDSVAKINLAKADDWNVVTNQTNDSITLTMVRSEAQGIVTFVWHIDTLNATVKFDTKVENWRWSNTSDHLVLQMLILGKNLKNETGANVSVEDAGYITWADSASATYPNGTTASLPVDAVRKTSKDEKDDDKDEHEDVRGAQLFLVFNGTGGYSQLTYDPTFGVYSSSTSASNVPGFAAPLAVVALAGLAVAMRRRK